MTLGVFFSYFGRLCAGHLRQPPASHMQAGQYDQSLIPQTEDTLFPTQPDSAAGLPWTTPSQSHHAVHKPITGDEPRREQHLVSIMRRSSPTVILALLTLVSLPILPLMTTPACAVDAGDDTLLTLPLMHPSEETLREWVYACETAPRTRATSLLRSTVLSRGSVDLLPHMVHIPSKRSQGTCGNCRVWADTGWMEIALSMQEDVRGRLSVQVVNSCRCVVGKFCRQGGWLHEFAGFYSISGRCPPERHECRLAGWRSPMQCAV